MLASHREKKTLPGSVDRFAGAVGAVADGSLDWLASLQIKMKISPSCESHAACRALAGLQVSAFFRIVLLDGFLLAHDRKDEAIEHAFEDQVRQSSLVPKKNRQPHRI